MKKKEDISESNNNVDILFKISELEKQLKSSQKATAHLRQDLTKIMRILRSLEVLFTKYLGL